MITIPLNSVVFVRFRFELQFKAFLLYRLIEKAYNSIFYGLDLEENEGCAAALYFCPFITVEFKS